jgi:phosphate transport system permease protein
MKRRRKAFLGKIGVGAVATVGLLVLAAILFYIVSEGAGLLSWKLVTGDYYAKTYDGYYDASLSGLVFETPNDLEEDAFFSAVWGVGLRDGEDAEGHAIIEIVSVDPDSPFAHLLDKTTGSEYAVTVGQTLDKVIFSDNAVLLSVNGAEAATALLDAATGIKDILTSTTGKGIRGSILTTLVLIVLTLACALPIGVFTALYLHEFAAKDSPVIRIVRRLIEMLTGIPSIIFGLLGAAVFIPFTSILTAADGGNLLSGSLTLAVIVLPVVISATEEALASIPQEYRAASLALGANRTQTTFKVVLRAASPGILTGTLLAIGRIIGESAALIYAVGTAIKDQVVLTERSTSLAVHIWSVMAGEVPNIELASAISLIILAVVLTLSLVVKLIVRRLSFATGMR